MPRVFLSHSSRDSRQAMAVKAWLIEQEPGLAEEIFLDLDPHPGMRLDTWDDTAAVRYDHTLWTELTSLRFLDGPHGACLLGPVGVGKTHLATALGHIAVRRVSVLMLRADAMFKRLKAARLDNSVEAEMHRLARVQLLLIDDFALQPLDATETADFYELVVARHHTASTVTTSNREPDEWLTMMSDPLLAQSAVDRLTSTAHELVIEGQSYRRRQKPHAPIDTTNPDRDGRKDDPVVPSSWQLGGATLVANDNRHISGTRAMRRPGRTPDPLACFHQRFADGFRQKFTRCFSRGGVKTDFVGSALYRFRRCSSLCTRVPRSSETEFGALDDRSHRADIDSSHLTKSIAATTAGSSGSSPSAGRTYRSATPCMPAGRG